MPRITALSLALMVWLSPAVGNGWNMVNEPLPGIPQVIGFYSAGCIAGALALPVESRGFQVMRPSRNRFYGHPTLIAFLEKLGRQAETQGRKLLIGDLSQPRGGPMAYGHRSHQIGLDADIWFRYVPSGQTLSRRETEALPMRSVVSAAKARVEPERWSPALRDLLRAAAASPEVERIFVNPIIKQFLCRGESDRAWLRKIRPWWGHDAHFHVRLRCPLDSPLCQEQKPVPRGDGCDKDLDKWVRELQQAALSPPPKQHKPSRKPVVLPVNCTAVLQHDGDPRRPVGLDVRR